MQTSTHDDSMSHQMFSDKAVFTLSEMACSEGQAAHRFVQTAVHDNDMITKPINNQHF
jgi:hypothetical protein